MFHGKLIDTKVIVCSGVVFLCVCVFVFNDIDELRAHCNFCYVARVIKTFNIKRCSRMVKSYVRFIRTLRSRANVYVPVHTRCSRPFGGRCDILIVRCSVGFWISTIKARGENTKWPTSASSRL